MNGRFRFNGIRGTDDRHTGNGAHNGEILIALMRSSIFAHGKTTVRGANLNVQVRISNGISDLLKSSARRKHGNRSGKDRTTGSSNTCGHTNHVGLGNAAVNKTLRICFAKLTRTRSFCKVSVEHEKIVMVAAKLYKSLAVRVARSDFFDFCHGYSASFSSSAIPWANCSSLGALPCQPTWPSINETPLPLMVWATITVG